MISVSIPNNNISERTYIINIIFGEFLGLECNITIDKDLTDYKIVLPNNSCVIIKDSFFSLHHETSTYLNKKNIPLNVSHISNEFIVEDNLPLIYGANDISVVSDLISCSIDVFASCFFMLTRWEEYVIKSRDIHHRFSAYKSLAFKNDFLKRPIVNEYVELLWNMLFLLDASLIRKNHKYKCYITHDVDRIDTWKNPMHLIKTVGGDLIKRKDLMKAGENFYQYFKIKLNLIKDPYDTFDFLMDESEKINTKSNFYFMSGGETTFDNWYNIDKVGVLINTIKKKKHRIGYHSSYNTYNNLELFIQEKERLEKISEFQITEGRQHYLRFEVPTTWQVWEDAGMLVDSTCGYAEKEGFRCGTATEYSVFNIITRKQLKLKERPLLVMEGSFYTYQPEMNLEEMLLNIKSIIKLVKKYNSNFVLLWHNSSFNKNRSRNFKDEYKCILQYLP